MTPLAHMAAAAVMAAMFLHPVPGHASDADDASKYIEKLGTQALAIISNAGFSKTQKQSKLDSMFVSSVDIPWVARFVLGRHWRQVSEAQKAAYLREYEKFLIKHYTSRFSDYTSGSFTITGVKDDNEGRYTVSMQLQGDKKNDPPVLVDYRVRKQNGGFKIFDVVVEGVSMITTQRSEFAAVVDKHSMDYLIAQLKEKSAYTPMSGAQKASR